MNGNRGGDPSLNRQLAGKEGRHKKHGGAVLWPLVVGFVAALGLLATIAGLEWRQATRVQDTERWVANTHEARAERNQLLTHILAVESAQRSYLLTGHPVFLEMFEQAVESVDPQLRKVEGLTQDDEQSSNLVALKQLIDERIEFARHTVDLRRDSDFESARSEVASLKGKELSDEIRALFVQMDTRSQELLNVRTTAAQTEASNTSRLTIVGTAMSFVLLIAVFALVFRESKLRQGAKEDAERASHAKSEFLSRMSHELRTPLNAILGFAQLIELRNEDPKTRESVGHILKGGRHLLGLINEVLDIARIESGKLTISLEAVEAERVFEQAVDLVTPIAKEDSVQIFVDRGSCSGIYVMADRQRLLQVFINLLSNAIKYNRHEGRIDVSCSAPDDKTYCITFSDTGTGISEEDQPMLFQPFERIAETYKEGTGLGLALSRKLVELMGGTLDLVSTGPDGTTFALVLRSSPSPIELAGPIPTSPGKQPQGRDLSAKILCVEDNLSNLKLIEHILSDRTNVTLIPAMQGRIGLALARQHLPALILMDVHLPDMNGAEVLRLLKSDPKTSSIPVVAMSADATEKQMKRMLAAGAIAYLTKPIDVAQFLATLDSTLGP